MQFYGLRQPADGRRVDDAIFVVSAKRRADITQDDTLDVSVMSTDFITKSVRSPLVRAYRIASSFFTFYWCFSINIGFDKFHSEFQYVWR